MDYIQFNKDKILIFVILFFLIISLSFSSKFKRCKNKESHDIENFVFLKQPNEITCGPTCGAMVLQYYGKDVSIHKVSIKSQTHWFDFLSIPYGMTFPNMLHSALNDLGLSCSLVKQGTLQDIEYYVSENRPPIVLLRNREYEWHYMVVIGYDKDNFKLAEPNWKGCRVVNKNKFLNAWKFNSNLKGNDYYDIAIIDILSFIGIYPCTMIVPN